MEFLLDDDDGVAAAALATAVARVAVVAAATTTTAVDDDEIQQPTQRAAHCALDKHPHKLKDDDDHGEGDTLRSELNRTNTKRQPVLAPEQNVVEWVKSNGFYRTTFISRLVPVRHIISTFFAVLKLYEPNKLNYV